MLLGDRFWAKVDRSGSCWTWTGATYWDGYGAFSVWVDGRRRTRRAHRVAYEALRGPIPAGLDLSPNCRNTACVNPDHMETITRRDNTLRRDTIPARNAVATHCHNEHEFTPANTYVWRGQRKCRACGAETARRRRARAA